jgi:hypothetical protein
MEDFAKPITKNAQAPEYGLKTAMLSGRLISVLRQLQLGVHTTFVQILLLTYSMHNSLGGSPVQFRV